MSDSGENKYKWTPDSTSLLVSVWTDKQVQKQLEFATKPQIIWDSVAKYMNKKGYPVNGKQCRSRMKHVLVCYREAKRAGTRAGVEQYYESIDQVLKLKKQEYNANQGVDTVDSNVKSPPKDVKHNKNVQMKHKYQQPPESMYRSDALSPSWSGRDDDYPDSPESNVTVLAQPFRVFSPVRDAATNTTQQQLSHTNKKVTQQNRLSEEVPSKENYRPSTGSSSNNFFSEVPFQNTVQNVQNQIIQENMQQNQAILQQNLLQNQLQNQFQMNTLLRPNVPNINPALYTDQGLQFGQAQMGMNGMTENGILKMQGKSQLNQFYNQAVPQEPIRKPSFRQNLVSHPQFQQDLAGMQNYNFQMNPLGLFSPSISPDIAPNLNEAMYQKNEKMNEASSRPSSNTRNQADMTTMTNNATFNDDTISIEFLADSPSPDHEPVKLNDFGVNTDEMPNAPFRKKKAEKLEKLMMSAISSQNEVVNKILAAQNEMVTRVLDLDRDRQNRLENRLDHLLDVVQTAVLNKSGDKSGELIPPPPLEPLFSNLAPPPKPGVMPPKLDLVPPKPCRVPCPNTGQQTNQNQFPQTRPGVVSPILSPTKRVGAIWQKLGPVSTSPFVRAQQQLGFRPVHAPGTDIRTQSSAERRIARECEGAKMDTKALQRETINFLEAERHIVEEVENARIRADIGEELQSRRRLFTQREPNVGMILSAAFIEAEMQSTEIIENARLRQKMQDRENNMYRYDNGRRNIDELRSSYERLRQLNMHERQVGDPMNSSTPAKPPRQHEQINQEESRPSIQQLAQLVMNSARWRTNNGVTTMDAANANQRKDLNFRAPATGNAHGEGDGVTIRNKPIQNTIPTAPALPDRLPNMDSNTKTLDWLQDRFAYGPTKTTTINQEVSKRASYAPPKTIGFTTEFLEESKKRRSEGNLNAEKRVGFTWDKSEEKTEKDPLEELRNLYIQKQINMHQNTGLPFFIHNGCVITPDSENFGKYIQEVINTKSKMNVEDSDSDRDEEFMDTTATMPARKNSLTSSGSKKDGACIIS
ncbi:uncharacterized protein LOC106648325 isoform X2 [Trichogramma pretiosum]|uniref:uncharacterized protein LOC106648325 isoform X2 n=1 Tax=Trichogramma pretiosum TaxID=7493 RepID=UPI0006C94E29|nr:uncharacterized protein LOC106648325 isoform X2 [Trichogramma pretiosum]